VTLRILFAASEAAPLTKTGGLADVAQALPRALHQAGHEVRVVMPAYRGVVQRAGHPPAIGSGTVFGHAYAIREATVDSRGPPCWLVDSGELFVRDGSPYLDGAGREYADNATRFAAFSEVVARLALGRAGISWKADVAHLNDWHTGLAAASLVRAGSRPACVFTIHNLAYQGNYPQSQYAALGLPPELLHPGALEFYGQFSFMKAGLVFADALSTVSETYAREILTPEYGDGMDGVLRSRAQVLTGIINGIDVDAWNPATDAAIERRYDLHSVGEGKRANREALRRSLGLVPDERQPVVAFIGRLAHQKGADLLLAAQPVLDDGGAQLVLLGAGDHRLELAFANWSRRKTGQVAVTLGYDEALAHRIEAGADMLVMPSRYEPCGLNQMYSQRYGTIPVVRRTGGLADTVIDAGPAPAADGSATGVLFDRADATDLAHGLARAISLWRDPGRWRSLQQAGMQRDFGWSRAAARYLELYRTAMKASSGSQVA
jgi:starch synthase